MGDDATPNVRELKNRATMCLYQCEHCATVIPLWATAYQVAQGQRWPPFMDHKACCETPYLEPEKAATGSTFDVQVCMRLVRMGEGNAVEKHWHDALEPVDVEDLPYRPSMKTQDEEVEA